VRASEVNAKPLGTTTPPKVRAPRQASQRYNAPTLAPCVGPFHAVTFAVLMLELPG
jgi:hypothetical protein